VPLDENLIAADLTLRQVEVTLLGSAHAKDPGHLNKFRVELSRLQCLQKIKKEEIVFELPTVGPASISTVVALFWLPNNV